VVDEFFLSGDRAVRADDGAAVKDAFIDNALVLPDGCPIAIDEVKRNLREALEGECQSAGYADRVKLKYGIDPFVFLTNGDEIWFWHRSLYPPRLVSGFFTRVPSTGKRSTETVYGLTDHTPASADAAAILAFNHCHWSIENSCHYILDWDEDRCTIRTGHGPANITALRRFAIGAIGAIKSKSRDTVAGTIQRLARNIRLVFESLGMTETPAAAREDGQRRQARTDYACCRSRCACSTPARRSSSTLVSAPAPS
jgi:hypothetical protein